MRSAWPARFVRQILLPEIGAEGQGLLARASACVGGDGLAAEVAVLYARGAGFGSIAPGAVDVDALAPASIVKIEPAREVLAGARATLDAMRARLRPEPSRS